MLIIIYYLHFSLINVIFSGSVAGTEKAMEDAQKLLEKSRNQQSEISEKLVEAVANALKLDICKELTEQVKVQYNKNRVIVN